MVTRYTRPLIGTQETLPSFSLGADQSLSSVFDLQPLQSLPSLQLRHGWGASGISHLSSSFPSLSSSAAAGSGGGGEPLSHGLSLILCLAAQRLLVAGGLVSKRAEGPDACRSAEGSGSGKERTQKGLPCVPSPISPLS